MRDDLLKGFVSGKCNGRGGGGWKLMLQSSEYVEISFSHCESERRIKEVLLVKTRIVYRIAIYCVL